MVERRTIAITGISAILMAGAAYFTWKKSAEHRIKYLENFSTWKKEKIANIYYGSLDERDIEWG